MYACIHSLPSVQLLGLFLTATLAEVCRLGYIPTDAELDLGVADPYADENGGQEPHVPARKTAANNYVFV
jgi:hypothetical protein